MPRSCAPRQSASGCGITAKPMIPISTPTTWLSVNCSSRNDAMTNAVYKGVIAFMMDAKPTLTMVCPAFRRLYGNTLSRTPMTRKGIHADAPRAPNGREP